jgi:2-keto-4-pentenoate hydratase
MDQDENAQARKIIAADAFAALVGTRQIPPFSSRPGGLSVDDAYRVTPRVRQLYEAGGAKVIGRKIGFSNRTIWPEYGVYAPIWGYVFDRSLHDLAALDTMPLASFSKPPIEPEIVFGLSAAPSAQMELGGPLSALRHLVGLLASDPLNPLLAAGEIISTGTLTQGHAGCRRRGVERGANRNCA